MSTTQGFDCSNPVHLGLALLVLIAVVAVIYCLYNKQQNKEPFGFGQDGTWKVQREIGTSQGNTFAIPGTYQSILTPRANMGVNYGAHINYNMPNLAHQAAPVNPLDFGDLKQDSKGPGKFETTNALGESEQPIIYDRLVYANRNNRLRSAGDPIRGDLPVVPHATGWFRPSAHPNIDLQTGAMSVMGGVDNDTTKQLAQLLAKTSGDTTVSGVNMAPYHEITSGSALADVQVTSYP